MKYELLRILVVDDNHHFRTILTTMLRSLGVSKIYEASDGSSALELMRVHDMDMVLADLSMEPMDGLDLVRLIRNAPDSKNDMIPVIMITGHSTLKRIGEARDAGVNEVLVKPITGRGVIDRINRVVNHPRPFIRTNDFYGPDRRRKVDPDYEGPKRRSSDTPDPRRPKAQIEL